jgi:hypothetical protein
MYVLVSEDEYNQAIENLIPLEGLHPNEYSLCEEGDFKVYMGNGGYVSSITTHETRDEQAKAAQGLANFYGSDICHVEGNILVFEPDASKKYAQKKIDGLKYAVSTMTPEEYLDMGEYHIRQFLRTTEIFVHTYSEFEETPDEFIQSADRFVIETLHGEENRRFVVTCTMVLHD